MYQFSTITVSVFINCHLNQDLNSSFYLTLHIYNINLLCICLFFLSQFILTLGLVPLSVKVVKIKGLQGLWHKRLQSQAPKKLGLHRPRLGSSPAYYRLHWDYRYVALVVPR